MRALAVSEDLPYLAKLSALLSQQSGIEVVGRASTGWEGLKLAAQLDCHLVVTDYNLPDMTGAAMALALKKNLRPPLVVIVSGQKGLEFLELAANAGADGYLLKDDISRLPALLRNIDPASASTTDRNRTATLFGRKRKPLLKDRNPGPTLMGGRSRGRRRPEDTG
ncbi:MAG TPA: response regulator transcription factor [Gammaproteobacteria bacterium]|nr:response regulator transcription factor [Gammaproteobacteria bacterium]